MIFIGIAQLKEGPEDAKRILTIAGILLLVVFFCGGMFLVGY